MPMADPTPAAAPPSKPFSLSFGSAKPKGIPTTAPKKRPHSALADPESDHDDEGGQPELVSAFNQSGIVVGNDTPKTKAPLAIPVDKNRDWREEIRKKRRKNLLPAEVQAAQRNGQSSNGGPDADVERDEVSTASGIQFVSQDQNGDTTMSESQTTHQTHTNAPQTAKSADEEAMEALLSGEKKSTLQIPTIQPAESNGHTPTETEIPDYANEDERFRADVASRPDVASLDDYAAVPVEEFGAAMLRGMGWKDGEAVGKRNAGVPAPKEPKIKERRPALLGIGAKETPGGVGDELGAWGKAVKGGKRKTDLTYNPVLLQNSKTGEKLTEEELRRKKEEVGNGGKEDDWRERRDRNLRIDRERKSERRERERLAIEDGRNGERSRDGRRDDDSRRRDRSSEREKRRRRSRSREHEGERNRDSDRRRRERSSDGGDSRYSSSSRRRSKSRERSRHHGHSRSERSRY
ncbi:DNA primase large subunit Spp2 [Lecanora helva]